MGKVAIIGFGCAGYNAAKTIRELNNETEIHVFSDTEQGPFNPMLTTYYAIGRLSYENMFPYGSLEKVKERLNLVMHSGIKVDSINPQKKELIFNNGTSDCFDSILIATGAFAQSGYENIDNVITVRNEEDAVKFRQILENKDIQRVVIVGASFVGIKAVEGAVLSGKKCTLVAGEWVFRSSLFEETARRVEKFITGQGVNLELHQRLNTVRKNTNGSLTVETIKGDSFECDAVVICMGVTPNTEFAGSSGIEINKGFIVDEYMKTNFEGIYAAGDCCEIKDFQSKETVLSGTWINALRQGENAGKNMAGKSTCMTESVQSNLCHFLGYDFISVGNKKICDSSDEIYEYEDGEKYIRVSKDSEGVKLLNYIGNAENSGLLKTLFERVMCVRESRVSRKYKVLMRAYSIPDSFIEFIC